MISALNIFFFQTAPEGFEIVDCTDHSITVEWNIHDLDNYLEYELVYRRQGSDEWKNKFLSKKDVTANNNGRYVYKLQNLSSDSSYELKLCSVDIHQVKSQHSQLQTIKTLKFGKRTFHFSFLLCILSSCII